MEPIKLADRISYFPATDNPLSAEVVLIRGDRYNWIYDVGNSDSVTDAINALPGENNIIISHYHIDHAGNLRKLKYGKLYWGEVNAKKTGLGISVTSEIFVDDGIKLTVFPVPSTHSKGAVGLLAGRKIAFIGDAVYPQYKDGKAAYNANILKRMITCLEATEAAQVALSHSSGFLHDKGSVINQLKEIYKTRTPGESYIFTD